MSSPAGDDVVRPSRHRLEAAGVRAVAMTMVDNGGITRVKAVPIARLERVAANGVGMAYIWGAAGTDDLFADVAPFDNPSGDMRLVPDLGAARIVTAAPGWAWAPVDQMTQELEPMPGCQRTVLHRTVDAARASGLDFRATFEVEATLFHDDGRPGHNGPGYSTTALALLDGFLFDLVDALESSGVEVEQFHPEYAPGQFEVSVAAADPLSAADTLVFVRTQMRFAARRHGLQVSFAPTAIAGEVGNGCHAHLSAWRDGTNLMQGGDGPAGTTAEGAAAVAGVLEALPGLLAVLAPSPAAYLRLQPHRWAGAYACWGVENREAAIRFIPGTVTSRERAANFEVKVGDGGANPYLVMALLVAAATDGVQRGLAPPEPTQDDPSTLTDVDLERLGITRLPTTLSEATGLFEGSGLARRVLGEGLHRAFAAVRRRECETHGGLGEQELADAYRWRY